MNRLGIISFFTLLFIAFVVVWNISYQSSLEEAYIPINTPSSTTLIPSESGVFERSEHAINYSKTPQDPAHERSLKDYYKNRAYHNAPPYIPHPVASGERSMGGKNCLQCHQDGGYVDKFKAYAPVTPHPEKVNCRQCHVEQKTNTLFKGSNFIKIPAPNVGKGANNYLPGSPPAIPHQLQMRENCLACHAGPSAPKEIRTTHPERINCRQCHVINNKETIDIGIFKRKP
ncbi:cytochrome C [Wenyingzhuangia fucanilytica]|uniref:Cytochrome C n=1 Tax=Wenyingzhuangia fucanilytica TaxID=1790137 RepID=A0A1B1Y2N2_9FLAO|nr:nitrate reductase cytochrome c-type subunit [Wenyingzhuangia fucanilytica]ANW95033.1 cytochrome C [Wenyingzhuangia fucanilytica]